MFLVVNKIFFNNMQFINEVSVSKKQVRVQMRHDRYYKISSRVVARGDAAQKTQVNQR